MERVPSVSGTANLLDILDRVLDKGLVIAGDVRISLANVELLTIRVRLLVCSVDKAEQIGLNWWKYDPHLSLPAPPIPPVLPERPEGQVRRRRPARGRARTRRR
ncbi:MAG: gas vesicle protein [Acidobacteria bacterium]|nr:gas vesicle protein [Acidobacteriota bacterium]MBV8894679.1 gas vesicle protein [Acidobacteriota bacterium]MBV9480736.1 gas vesicle protein [Acidobacteriota bacterium]